MSATAVDTNVLLDVLVSGSPFGDGSARALAAAREEGALVISEIVLAELAAAFGGDAERRDSFLADVGIRLLRSDPDTLAAAGRIWRRYRDAGGPSGRILPDFLVGAHALAHTDRLLTRDRGVYRAWFEGLAIVDPTTE